MPDILSIAALAIAVTALAVSAGCVAATRVFLRNLVATLSQPPKPSARTLTPAEERKLRADFDSALRDHRRVR